MAKKAEERIKFIKEHPYMGRAKIAEVLEIGPSYLTKFAEKHGLVLKGSDEILEELVRENGHCSAQEIAKIVEERMEKSYTTSHICSIARKLDLTLPRSQSEEEPVIEKKVIVQVEPELGLLARIKKEEEIQSPDYKKPRKQRCPAVYTQSSSPYGMAEKLGVTVRTVK